MQKEQYTKIARETEQFCSDYVVFDFETTGISVGRDAIIEISAIKVIDHQIAGTFSTLVNPERKIPYSATKVNHITDAMVKDAPILRTALERFLEFIEGYTLVGHNIASFDIRFLHRDCKECFGMIPKNRYLDTLRLARKSLPELPHHRLVDLADHFGVNTDGAHRALKDCEMNQYVFERLMELSGQSKKSNKTNKEEKKELKPAKPAGVTIRGVVERITYQNPENGYSVLKCAVKGYSELVTVVGNLLDVYVGSVLLIQGNWKMDSRYGRQFAAETWEETLPATIYGIEKYLGSGLIKGVGPKYAKKIVQKFGTDTIDVIETDIHRLSEVEGIGNKRIKMIQESWEKQKEIKNLMIFLQEHGVSTSFAAKIYREYGNESIEKVKQNPYRLADDIWGIGFRTADQIAEKLGFAPEAFVRLRSGILYTLSNMSDDGHVFLNKSQLTAKAAELLNAEETFIVMTLDQMLKDRDVFLQQYERENLSTGDIECCDAIYLPPFYYAETGCAAKLRALNQAEAQDILWVRLKAEREKYNNHNLSIDVSHIEKRVNMQYDEVQADAIRKAADSKVMILTGGPGTGKTTTTLGIIAAYQTFGLKILLAAPTGRAAKRMTEATGMEAKTIHRLLEYKPPEGYQKNEDCPLEGDVLIVDECSMIDVILMNALLKAIPPHMRLVLVGDIDQLPSVGAGNVLRDIIDSECFPVIRLTKIFRQAQSSRIITNAHRINEGKMPDVSNGKQTDFFFMEREEPQLCADTIVELVQKKLPSYYQVDCSSIQVLTPMQKGVVGAANLNQILQQALNPQNEGLRRAGVIYRLHDRVMQIRNNYDKEVFNGDIGEIEEVDLTARTLKVLFDQRSVTYEISELDELVLAYATTIHKAQGSEYPIVVMPVLMNHYVMLQRNLIYTGITRAKKILILVGTKKALSYSVDHVTVTKRNTLLRERIRGTVVPLYTFAVD